jgi:hypothetical protein
MTATADTELLIRLPKPHAKQRDFLDSTAKRKVIVAGRRGGKTTGSAILAVRSMLKGRRVLQAAPTQDQTDAFWATCKKALAEPIAAGIVGKNESKRYLEMANGGRIRTKTAWDADTLRGDYADDMILEEYSLMDPNAWEEVAAPMLLDNDGDAVFIFTPMRKNHAYYHWLRATNDETGRWAAWHFTSHDNPHLSPAALEEITADMTEDAYRQEILAEFLEGEGSVFRNIRACLGAPLDARPEDHKGHFVVIGADWAKSKDRTAFSVLCGTCKQELALDYFRGIDYHVQRARLRVVYDKWGVEFVHAESNAMGEPIIDELRRENVNVRPFQTTPSSKPPLIENLALCFEREDFQWLPDQLALGELESYERKVSPITGRSQYSAPEGLHDDTVIARALAAQGAQMGAFRVVIV